MLLHEILKDYKIILASASPRRADLMRGAGLTFEIDTSFGVEENYPNDLALEEVPGYLSRLKSEAYGRSLDPREILITADTVVICKGRILGKPENMGMAQGILRQLSGGDHQVMTGVTIRTADREQTFTVTTTVRFAHLSDKEIAYYLENYNPLDKAGSYGIQEWIGYIGIERVEGSFYNVVGLPVQALCAKLKEMFASR